MLKTRVREHDIGSLELHKRGVPVTPDAVRAAVRPHGQAHETWIMTRVGNAGDAQRARGAVIVVEPCEAPTVPVS